MTLKLSLHVFSYGADIFSGHLAHFTSADGTVQFTYHYDWKGEKLSGAFTGEVSKDGMSVSGAWKDQSLHPIDGKSSWQGSATFRTTEVEGRCIFHGTWSTIGEGGRWIVDVVTG